MKKFGETSVKDLWKEVKNDHYIKTYFPDYPKNVLPDAEYFYSIINTIYDG